MSEPRVQPYGSWQSPISIDMAVSSSVALQQPRIDGDDIYWTEGRPAEMGRQVIVRRRSDGTIEDVTPPGFNARTMAHEYGGGWYAVHAGTVYSVSIDDQRIYVQAAGGAPQPLTLAGPFRYGDLWFDRAHDRLLCVREDFSDVDPTKRGSDGRAQDPVEAVVAIDPASGAARVLVDGYDFFSTPRPSPDGRQLAWLAWRHPNMPWDTTELWLAEVDGDGLPQNARMIAGGGQESIVQPEWTPDGTLVFVSDRSGWWNLYRWSESGAQPVASMAAEFAGPQWVFGMTWYGVDDDGTIVASVRANSREELWLFPRQGAGRRLEVPDDDIASLVVGGGRIVYVGGSPTEPSAIVSLERHSGRREVLRRSFNVDFPAEYLSRPEPITFPTTDGGVAHALFYRPTNPDFNAPAGERPPLIVTIHGGPTSNTGGTLSLGRLFFTSRGFAVVDVDYRGSSGYGREYMRQLDGKWGVYDIDDVVAAARYLTERGDVDGRRMAIRGGSAGGYTTLAALAFRDVFAAGASYFGVGDLGALARDTHKFESRYLDRLVAPWPAGEAVYRERSALYHADQISRPLLVLQGEDDMVVPVAQAQEMVAALRRNGVPYAYIAFPGEGHGFRRAANIRRSLEAEWSFYAQLFGFAPADTFEPIKIEGATTAA
jgi:dipeptidyl aminopeptidase/acylaminoacyl peptidase